MNIRGDTSTVLDLTFKECLLYSDTRPEQELIERTLVNLSKAVSGIDEDDEDAVIVTTIGNICRKMLVLKTKPTVKGILSEIKLSVMGELYDDLKDAYEDVLSSNIDSEKEIKTAIAANVRLLNHAYVLSEVNRTIYMANARIQSSTAVGDLQATEDELEELINKLTSFISEATGQQHEIVEELDFSNTESVAEKFDRLIAVEEEEGGFTTGSKKLDSALGGRIRKRKIMCNMALAYMNKSGFLRSLGAGIAVNNYPEISIEDQENGMFYQDNDDGTKTLMDSSGKPTKHSRQPLLLKATLEDEVEDDIKFAYQYFKMLYDHEEIEDVTKIDKQEVVKYVTECYGKNGWAFKIIRLDPQVTTYKTITQICDQYNADGYRVDLLMIDYLTLVSTKGCRQGVIGDDIMDLFRKIRSYISLNNIACITPHQLRTRAKDLLSEEGVTDRNFAREIAGAGHASGSRSIDRELDVLINQHIVHHSDGRAYQNVYIEKVRGHIIPVSNQNLYIQFPKNAPLIINDETVRTTLPVV